MSKEQIDRILDKLESQETKIDEIHDSQIRTENDIKYHIKRTNLLEDLHKNSEKRITKLEEPIKARNYIVSVALKLGALAGAIYAITRLF